MWCCGRGSCLGRLHGWSSWWGRLSWRDFTGIIVRFRMGSLSRIWRGLAGIWIRLLLWTLIAEFIRTIRLMAFNADGGEIIMIKTCLSSVRYSKRWLVRAPALQIRLHSMPNNFFPSRGIENLFQ